MTEQRLHRNYSELVGGLSESWYVEDVGNGVDGWADEWGATKEKKRCPWTTSSVDG